MRDSFADLHLTGCKFLMEKITKSLCHKISPQFPCPHLKRLGNNWVGRNIAAWIVMCRGRIVLGVSIEFNGCTMGLLIGVQLGTLLLRVGPNLFSN